MTGEAWSVITGKECLPPLCTNVSNNTSYLQGKGSKFSDEKKPHVVVQVGAPSSVGKVEISDIIFSTVGPAPGAIVVEWNVKESQQGGAGMWDSHIRYFQTFETPGCPLD
jgi:hypothetical protein